MGCLKRLKHQNVVRVVGYHVGKTLEDNCLILEWCSNGNLYDWCSAGHTLSQKVQLVSALPHNHKTFLIIFERRFKKIKAIAEGLRYVHKEGIAHADLKPVGRIVEISVHHSIPNPLFEIG